MNKYKITAQLLNELKELDDDTRMVHNVLSERSS